MLPKGNPFIKDGKVSVSKVEATSNLKESVKKAVQLIGGFRKTIFQGDKVIVKPNSNSDDPFPASSDPEFVKAIVSMLYEAGASKVTIVESSGLPWLPTGQVMEKMGMVKAAEECNAELKVLDDKEWVDMKIEGKHWKTVTVAKDVLEKDAKLIWLPCMKTHRHARFSLSLKLAVGLLDFEQRRDLHAAHLEEKIAELNLAVRPHLIIMDGRKCFVADGPDKGLVKQPNLILASGDRVAIDVAALEILKSYRAENRLDMSLWEFPQIKHAIELGLGVKSKDEMQVIKGLFRKISLLLASPATIN